MSVHAESMSFDIDKIAGGFFFIAGPCAMESRDMVLRTAEEVNNICDKRGVPVIFKSSFDKANRTSAAGGRGIGLEEGLKLLSEVGSQFNMPVTTDVHLPEQAAAVAEAADVLQIPAFLCRQTDLIEACAKTGRWLNIKKGQFLSPAEMLQVAAKAKASGAKRVMLCERGTTFGYHNLVADMRSLVELRAAGCPVVFDATHSVQLPGAGGSFSGGERRMVLPLSRAAAAAGVDGIFAEVHPSPEEAVSDAATQLPLSRFGEFVDAVLAVHNATSRAADE